MLLFTLVIIRLYAKRGPQDDEQIYRLVSDSVEEVVAGEKARADALKKRQKQSTAPGPTESGEDEVSEHDEPPIRPRYRLFRQRTFPEQAAAARLGHVRTIINGQDDPKHRASVTLRQSMINVKKKNFELSKDEPHIDVWSRDDVPPYFWTKSTTPGLTGGPIYMPYNAMVTTGIRFGNDIPRPRPTAVRRKRVGSEVVEESALAVKRLKKS